MTKRSVFCEENGGKGCVGVKGRPRADVIVLVSDAEPAVVLWTSGVTMEDEEPPQMLDGVSQCSHMPINGEVVERLALQVCPRGFQHPILREPGKIIRSPAVKDDVSPLNTSLIDRHTDLVYFGIRPDVQQTAAVVSVAESTGQQTARLKECPVDGQVVVPFADVRVVG